MGVVVRTANSTPTDLATRWARGGDDAARHAGRGGGLAFVTAGDSSRLTGGYLYNRHMLKAMRAAALSAMEVGLPTLPPFQATRELRAILAWLRPAVVVVDSIAMEGVFPLLARPENDLPYWVVPLMHMLPSDVARGPRRIAVRRLEMAFLAAADHVVAVSPYLRDRLITVGARAEELSVVLPGRDGVPNLGKVAGIPGRTRFLCVANWSPAKGILELVEALARVRSPVELDLVGERGPEGYAGQVEAAITRHGLGDRIRRHEPSRGRVLGERFAAADVFVLPSRTEAFGTVFAEAMNLGLPVIGCEVGALPWLVEKGCGLLVPRDDVKALAEAMESLAKDPRLQRRLGEGAWRRAQALPTWRDTGETFVSLMETLLARPRQAAAGLVSAASLTIVT